MNGYQDIQRLFYGGRHNRSAENRLCRSSKQCWLPLELVIRVATSYRFHMPSRPLKIRNQGPVLQSPISLIPD